MSEIQNLLRAFSPLLALSFHREIGGWGQRCPLALLRCKIVHEEDPALVRKRLELRPPADQGRAWVARVHNTVQSESRESMSRVQECVACEMTTGEAMSRVWCCQMRHFMQVMHTSGCPRCCQNVYITGISKKSVSTITCRHGPQTHLLSRERAAMSSRVCVSPIVASSTSLRVVCVICRVS